MPHHVANANVQRIGNFVVVHTTEVAQFHHSGCNRIAHFQQLQGLLQLQPVDLLAPRDARGHAQKMRAMWVRLGAKLAKHRQ
jgi:hypothetical protein